MSGFIDQIAARAQGYPRADRPRVHLRRRSRFEPGPVPRQRVTAPQPDAPAAANPPVPPPSHSRPVPRDQPIETAPVPPGRTNQPHQDAPVALPDPLVLVRDRVVPVLVQAGVLDSDEQPSVVDAETPFAAAEPGEVELRVEAHEYRAAPLILPAMASESPASPPDIHVHIDRIEVLRPQAKASPPPAPRVPPRRVVDHGEYLARRRDRR